MKNNKILIFLIALYSLLMLSVISWGVPTEARPFTYNMDEWHQLQSVRYLFAYGTPNIPGAAHGSIFQFFLSGVHLIPFVIFKFVDPFAINSLIDNLVMQGKLFVVMRLNTLMFGILTLITLAIIIKRYFKSNPILVAIFTIGTPIWLTLSSYFKYDIALIFWITLSILFLLRYAKYPTQKNFIFSAIPCALSLATKVSAVPILAIYVFGFFLFTPNWYKKYKYLVLGISAFLGIFIVFGIPDLFLRLGDYAEYLSSNLITSVKADDNYLLGTPNKWIYILFTLFPMIFGHIFYPLFLVVLAYWLIKIIKWFYLKKYTAHRNEIFLFFSFAVFFLSLIPLGLGGSGNRALVLLPFFSLLSAKFIADILKLKKYRVYVFILIIILALVQFYESSVVVYSRYNKNVLQESSAWIAKNLPEGITIGIENIPIYQTLPYVVLKEYYVSALDKYAKTKYKYEIIDASTKELPQIVIITNRYVSEKYLIKSPKKDLLMRLKKENYQNIKEFMPNSKLYKLYNDDLGYYLSGLNFVLPVTIYERG